MAEPTEALTGGMSNRSLKLLPDRRNISMANETKLSEVIEIITSYTQKNTKGINPFDRAFVSGLDEELGPLYGPPQYGHPQSD